MADLHVLVESARSLCYATASAAGCGTVAGAGEDAADTAGDQARLALLAAAAATARTR